MNISQLMRNYLGETAGSDTRAMELKTGQTVRGIVLQIMENNEAVVQINGVQVRAKLEAPLQQGQSALLQVQPQSSGAMIVLKQVEPSAIGLPEENFKEWAKALGLPETKWALALIKDLRREGLVLTRDVSQAFQQIAASLPDGVDMGQWMQAAAAAHKRGLPMTASVVASLRQVMFGQEAHVLLDTLQKQLAAMTSGAGTLVHEGGDGAAKAKQLPPAAARVAALLAEGAAILQGAVEDENGGHAELPKMSREVLPAGHKAETGTGRPAEQAGGGSLPETASDSDARQQESEGLNRPTPGSSANWLGQMMKWLGVDHELQLAKAVSLPEASAAPASSQPQGAAVSQPQAQASLQPQPSVSSTAASAASAALQEGTSTDGTETAGQAAAAARPMTASVEQETGQARSRVTGSTGSSEHEAATAAHANAESADSQPPKAGSEARTAVERPALTLSQLLAGGTGSDVLRQESAAVQQGQPAGQQQTQLAQQQETLKSALLSLLSADDVPAAVKETAGQLVSQITGQQLLLTPERNSSILTHVTMFIPLHGQDGSQTASVHIQTRRGRKGELDAANCRLLFNLSMKRLGDTLVDVNVVDKIVSLNLWNDHPAIGQLADASRAEVAERLQEAGYQLSSLRTTPLPKEGEQQPAPIKNAKTPARPDLAQFSPTRYKGVDYKI